MSSCNVTRREVGTIVYKDANKVMHFFTNNNCEGSPKYSFSEWGGKVPNFVAFLGSLSRQKNK